jgi:hypothetical protein
MDCRVKPGNDAVARLAQLDAPAFADYLAWA